MDPTVTELDALLAERDVHPLFQPIVDLASGEVVAHEALARGPRGGPLERPDELFARARDAGRLGELDLLCRERALEEAARAGMSGPLGLFLNAEPGPLASSGPLRTEALDALRARGVMPVVEITERALTDDPAGLLAVADRVRAHGGHIALDDVGADPDSLALMPFLRPDVVKLDLRLVQDQPDQDVAETMTAVTAYAERSGACVLAEGIETTGHERMARSLGATLGQGWRYGPPAPLPPRTGPPRRRLVLPRRDGDLVEHCPFRAATRHRAPQQATKSLLVAVSKLLERQARELAGLAVVLAAFEHVRHVTPATRRRYTELGRSAAFVVVLGEGVPPEPAPWVRGADLDPADPVINEWDVAVVGPHFAAALVARDRHVVAPDPERLFDYVLTYDRDVVLDVARSLMSRALPAAPRERAAASPAQAPIA